MAIAPKTLTSLNINRLSQPQIRILLEFMGVRTPPNGKPAKAKLLTEFLESQPDKVQAGYDVIVRHKMPSFDKAGTETIEQMEARMMALCAKLFDEEQFSLMKQVAEALGTDLAGKAETALKTAAEEYRPIVVKAGSKSRKVKGILPKEFDTMIALGECRIPIFLAGPAGCGKTYLAGKLAEALGLKNYADQSFSEGITEADLIGRMLPTGKGGAFEFHPAPLLQIFEEGGVFLFDEMDAADPNLLVFINKLLANDEIFVPQRVGNERVKKHKDFVAIAAANTWGTGSDATYVGRNALDAATMDRFRSGMIPMDYSERVERSLATEEVYKWGITVRKAIYKHRIRRIMSTRTLKNMTVLAERAGWGMDEWNARYFADWSEDEKRLVMQELDNVFSSSNV